MKTWICTAGAALLLSFSPGAMAVNYPTELRISVGVSEIEPPSLLLGFHNNEGDRVKFEIEVTIVGQPLGPSGVNDSVRCVRSSANGDDCKGAVRGNLREPWTTEKGWRAVVLAPVDKVKFDTDYCFRVQAIDDTGRHSAWAPWACAHTPPLPKRPAVTLPMPQVTLLDAGGDGRGQVGAATPGRMLIEWTPGSRFQGWYAVERSRAVAGPTWQEVGRMVAPTDLSGRDLELVDAIKEASSLPGPTNPMNYRICAVNIGGKTCSIPRRYPSASLKQEIANTAPASRTSPRDVTVSAAGSSTALRIAAPQILSPAPGSRVVQGLLRLQISATPGTENGQGEVEFSWQEPRQQKGSDLPTTAVANTVWKVSMARLAQGALVPPGEGPSQAGVWVARVRSVRGASPDPWSEPVSFTFNVSGLVRSGTSAVLAHAPAQAIAAIPAPAPAPLSKAPTAMGARTAGSPLVWGKAAPSAFGTQSPRTQP